MNKLGIFVNFWEKKWGIDYRYYIDKVQKLGYDILEFQAQPLLEMTNEECRAIKKYADERGIKLSYSLGLNPKYDISNPVKEVRAGGIKYLSNIVRKIAVMEGELFSGVTYAGWGIPSYFVDEAEKEALYCRSVESMKEVMKVAEKEGVTVCCEAVNRFESPLVNTAAEAIRYADLVDSKNIGIHLDTYHMNIEENNIGDAIRLVGKRLRHFHTGENNRNVPGRGHLDWDEIFKALKDIDYKNDIVSEPFLMMGDEVGYDIRVWRPILENPTEERLDQEARFLLEFTKGMMKKYEM
ncbi:MAG: sugar phosphate isomerase/epimerase [Lachnospiraceae bacterium]|nr:sugar phosphate isomerase/epimerase [Lachnospiraceae bacterium]